MVKLIFLRTMSTNDQEFMLNLGTKMITLLGFITILGLLIERLATGAISIGAFGAIFYSLDDMYSFDTNFLKKRKFGKVFCVFFFFPFWMDRMFM